MSWVKLAQKGKILEGLRWPKGDPTRLVTAYGWEGKTYPRMAVCVGVSERQVEFPTDSTLVFIESWKKDSATSNWGSLEGFYEETLPDVLSMTVSALAAFNKRKS